jgi:hypothetical protein
MRTIPHLSGGRRPSQHRCQRVGHPQQEGELCGGLAGPQVGVCMSAGLHRAEGAEGGACMSADSNRAEEVACMSAGFDGVVRGACMCAILDRAVPSHSQCVYLASHVGKFGHNVQYTTLAHHLFVHNSILLKSALVLPFRSQ